MVGHDGRAYASGGEVEHPHLEELDDEPYDGDGDEVAHPDERMGSNREDGWELEERQANEGEATEQQAGTELLRGGAFADAIRRSRRHMADSTPAEMYADGGDVRLDIQAGPPERMRPKGDVKVDVVAGPPERMIGPTPEQLAEMKRKKYGFGKRGG